MATVTIHLTDRYGITLANVTDIAWSWFDEDAVESLTTAVVAGTAGETDASGDMTLTLTGTTLTTGDSGTLLLTSGSSIGAYILAVD